MNGSNVIAQRNSDGSFYWLHQDHLGSGRKMTDTSGTMTYRAEFDPYGKLLLEWSQGNVANRNSKKFTGYERDAATGLDYAQARMYGSEWGRFLSPDPLGFASANKKSPKSLNRYSYVEGNPVNAIDPSGNLLANPDEGGSACSFGFWGTGYGDGFGNFTITCVWGSFWSCSIPTYGDSGGGEEQKPKGVKYWYPTPDWSSLIKGKLSQNSFQDFINSWIKGVEKETNTKAYFRSIGRALLITDIVLDFDGTYDGGNYGATNSFGGSPNDGAKNGKSGTIYISAALVARFSSPEYTIFNSTRGQRILF